MRIALPSGTGFPRADVADDFLRARRRQAAARLAYRIRRLPGCASQLVPLDTVVGALVLTSRPGGTGARQYCCGSDLS